MGHSIRRRSLSVLSGLSVLVAVAACGNAADAASEGEPPATASPRAMDETADAGSMDTAGDAFVDGTYTAEGSYQTPGGQESVEVELTVADDVVTGVTVTPQATGGNAERFQGQFASGIADEVVGQDLAGLAVDKVSGSSLTSGGFNAALDQIRADAAA